MKRACACAIAVALGILGCGSSSTEDEAKPDEVKPVPPKPKIMATSSPKIKMTGPRLAALALPESEGIVTDANGDEWRAHRATTFAGSPLSDLRAESKWGDDEDSLSDEDLADRMRPTMLHYRADGVVWMYEKLRGDVEIVRQARARKRAGWSMRVERDGTVTEGVVLGPPKPPKGMDSQSAISGMSKAGSYGRDLWHPSPDIDIAPAEDPFIPAFGRGRIGAASSQAAALARWAYEPRLSAASPGVFPSGPGVILGPGSPPPDERFFASPLYVASWPAKPQVSLWPTTGGGCSATMIGQYTMYTAAHCVWQDVSRGGPAPIGAPRNPVLWAVGVVQRTKPGYDERTSEYPSGNIQSTVRTNCLYVFFPNAFKIQHGPHVEDYALLEIDQACGLTPGPTTGTVAPAFSGSSSDYFVSQSKLFAYDILHPFPPQNQSPWTYWGPTLIGRHYASSQIWWKIPSGALLEGYMDTTGGASGGCLLKQLFIIGGDPTWYCTATTVAEYYTGNIWRSLDWTSWLFFASVSSEF